VDVGFEVSNDVKGRFCSREEEEQLERLSKANVACVLFGKRLMFLNLCNDFVEARCSFI